MWSQVFIESDVSPSIMIIIICMVVADPMLPRIWVWGQANMGLSFIVHAVSKDCISMIYSTGLNTSFWGEGIWEGNSFLFTSFGFLPDRVKHRRGSKIALLKLVKKGGRLTWRMVNRTLGSCVAEYCARLACRWFSDERGSLHLNQYPKSVLKS